MPHLRYREKLLEALKRGQEIYGKDGWFTTQSLADSVGIHVELAFTTLVACKHDGTILQWPERKHADWKWRLNDEGVID